MRVLLVFGTRPEAIKMAPLVNVLRRSPNMEVHTCVTGQHRQMLDPVLQWFQITPDDDLNLMQLDQTLANLTARTLSGITQVMERVQPDVVLVQGDTTTAMTAALAAFYLRVPVGHVEAGLRTYDLANPFPEELNRRIISLATNYHFAPTQAAYNALVKEGVRESRVFLTGNTVIDALQWTLSQPYDLQSELPEVPTNSRIVLVTAHRREHFGEEFRGICQALRQIVERNPNVSIVYPVHLNPSVQKPVYQFLEGVPRIHLLPPLAYPAFVHLLARAYIVMTDSGGLQEEAPALGKPVLVMRQTTERPEAVEAGAAKLVGTEPKAIIAAAEALLNDAQLYQTMAQAVSPYGDGHAAERIGEILQGVARV